MMIMFTWSCRHNPLANHNPWVGNRIVYGGLRPETDLKYQENVLVLVMLVVMVVLAVLVVVLFKLVLVLVVIFVGLVINIAPGK